MQKLQDIVEKMLFCSRWVLAPMYLGLVLALLVLITKFALMFMHTFDPKIFGDPNPAKLVFAILELVDITLVANLVLIIIFSGYENFVSKIDVAEGHKDRPSWMGTIDYSGLKLKIIGSVVAISSIHLLGAFIGLGEKNPDGTLIPTDHAILGWKAGLHLTFVVSGVLFAIMEKISHSTPSHGPSASHAAAEKAEAVHSERD